MKKLLSALVLGYLLVCSPSLYAGDVADGLRDGSFWETSARQNPAFQGVRFARVDETTIRIPSIGGFQIGGLKFGEILLVYDEEHVPVSMTVMMYNKGDDGVIDKAGFDAVVKNATAALDSLTGVQGKARKVSKKEAGLKLNATQWEWENGAARLEVSSSGKADDFKAEFVRLKIAPDAEGLERGGAADTLARSKLKGNIKKEGKACWIEGIPMVDQGQKGYCVPATLSRLFAYYGMDGVDQHTLAALCNSSGEGGTSHSGMEDALKKISSSFHVRLTKLDGYSIYQIPAKNYNKIAKRMNKPDLSRNFRENPPDGEVLKELCGGKAAVLRKWMTPIAKNIDAGIPVVWSVLLGIYPEPGVPQTMGGHMRMIIGYDFDKNEIIYSDSWGNGHELKRMPADQACAITAARYVLRPTR